VDNAYKAAVAALHGKVNDDTFRGYNAGEVLFTGASGTWRGDNSDFGWEISFNFAVKFNQTGVSYAGQTISYNGWDHLETEYKWAVDTTTNRLIQVPTGVKVIPLYPEGDFDGLEI